MFKTPTNKSMEMQRSLWWDRKNAMKRPSREVLTVTFRVDPEINMTTSEPELTSSCWRRPNT